MAPAIPTYHHKFHSRIQSLGEHMPRHANMETGTDSIHMEGDWDGWRRRERRKQPPTREGEKKGETGGQGEAGKGAWGNQAWLMHLHTSHIISSLISSLISPFSHLLSHLCVNSLRDGVLTMSDKHLALSDNGIQARIYVKTGMCLFSAYGACARAQNHGGMTWNN